MATTSLHNKKSSAVRRILSEARELSTDRSDLYTASPLEDNIFEWHFTLRGPANTEFANGLYHGRILLPAEYPMRPPNLMLLTPNGRFELNKKICLTFTGFHEQMWQPAWGVRTALLGLQTFMTAKDQAAVGIGALDYPVNARERLADESRRWRCQVCAKSTLEMLPDPDPHHEREHMQEEVPAAAPAAAASAAPADQPAPLPEENTRDAQTGASASSQHHPASEPTAIRNLAAPTPIVAPAAPSPTPATDAPTLPNTISSSSSSAVAPTNSRSVSVSATQQKLALIDNCIKALGVLVALLIFKRLI